MSRRSADDDRRPCLVCGGPRSAHDHDYDPVRDADVQWGDEDHGYEPGNEVPPNDRTD